MDIMDPPEELLLKNISEEKLKREINNIGHPEAKTHRPINYDDFNFDDFQFKPKKKTQSQAINDDMPVVPIAVLACPLCGCKNKTDFAKARHLKECAKKRGISFAKILEAVELQNRQAEERRLAGLPIVPSKPARESRRNTTIKRQLMPQTELQADLQMALAMSLSLQQKREKEEDQERFFLEALTGESENEDKKLITALRIGSTSDEKLQAPPGRKIRRRQQEVTPFWLMRSKEETKMIRAERVVKILSEQATDSDEENCPFILNWKNIRQHCTIPWPSAGYCHLWKASMLSETIRSDSDNFYVKTLKHWFPSQGVLNPKMAKQHSVDPQERRKTEETECLPSTLAALNALRANASLTQENITVEAGLDGFLLDNTYGDGFFTQLQKTETCLDFSSQVAKRLLRMVNNDALSDIEIIIKNDEVIHCHKFILYANCPDAYQELVGNAVDQILIWPDISHEGAITFLQFVYGGVFTGSNKQEMLQLAIRYNMQELVNLLSNSASYDGASDDHEQFVEPLSSKLNSGSGSSSPISVGSYNPSPVITSKKLLAGSSSPVLTSETSNSKPSTHDLTEKSALDILNERLHCEDASSGERIHLSSRKPKSLNNKLPHNGSSMMSPELFSSVHDQKLKITDEITGDNKLSRTVSNLERSDTPLEAPLCSPMYNFTPRTSTSTPIPNNLLLTRQKAKTFSISPVLAEQSVCLQSSQCYGPKYLLGVSKCAKTCSKSGESCIASDTPEINLQVSGNLAKIRSLDKIYDAEESWEKFNYESENDGHENRYQSDGGSEASLESLVLESLHNASYSEDKDLLGLLSAHGKRNLALTSLTSNSSSKRMKIKSEPYSNSRFYTSSPKEEATHVSKQNLDVQMLQLSNDLLPSPDDVSDEDVLETYTKAEYELQVENIALSSSMSQSLKRLSTPVSMKSTDNFFGQNSTWNDFPEGYGSGDNLHLVDSMLSEQNNHQDTDCYNHLLTPQKRPQSSASSAGRTPSTSAANAVTHENFVNISDKCNGSLENVPSFGSQDSIGNDDLADNCNNRELSHSESDLPDIDPYPLRFESVHLEEACVANCAPECESQSSTPLEKMSMKKKKKLSKKLPKEMCITPMPHYSIMETPLIKKELKKIGVRALPKKKGVSILKHVFKETHPENSSHASKESPSKPKSPSLKRNRASSRSVSDKCLSLDDSYNSIFKDEVGVKNIKQSTKSKKKVGKTVDTLEIQSCRSQSREKKASPLKGTPEKGGNKQAPSVMQNDEMRAFIFINEELRAKIVNYKPIDFKCLYSEMKAAGLKPTVQELQDFLDDQCITYTSMEELSPRKSKKRTCRRGKTQQ